jgi:hypothetical protein
MLLQSTDLLQPAVAFSLNVDPGTGAAFSDAAAAGTMRAEIAAVARVVADAVLLTSVFEWQTGTFTAFSDSDPANTRGNLYNNTDAMVEAIGGAALPGGGRRRLAAPAPAARPPYTRGRRLEFAFSSLANSSAFVADPSRAGATASFVVVTPSTDAAAAVKALLLSSSPSKDLSQSLYLIAGLLNASTVSVSINRTSVRLVTLPYRRTRWALVWDWIRAHIVATVAVGSTLIVLFILGAAARAWWRRRAETLHRFKRRKAVTPYLEKGVVAPDPNDDGALDDPLAVASALTAKRSLALASLSEGYRANRQQHRMSNQLQLLLDPSREPPAAGALAAAAVETGAPAAARARRRTRANAWASPPLGLNLAYEGTDTASAVYTEPNAPTRSDASLDVSPPATLRSHFQPGSVAFRVEGDAIDELLATRTSTGTGAGVRISLPGTATGPASPSNLERAASSLLVLPPGATSAPQGMNMVPL